MQPNKVYFRGGDHQLMLSAFIGELMQKGDGDPENLFKVNHIVVRRHRRASRIGDRLHDADASLISFRSAPHFARRRGRK